MRTTTVLTELGVAPPVTAPRPEDLVPDDRSPRPPGEAGLGIPIEV
jgi:hypothetical protein